MNEEPKSDIHIQPSDVVWFHLHWEREGVATLEYRHADNKQKFLLAKTEDEKVALVKFCGQMEDRLKELRLLFHQEE